MKNEDINIYITYQEYNKIFSNTSKQIAINVNMESISFPEALLDTFINNTEYYDALKEGLSKRENINLILTQGDVILLKKVYSPLSIVLGIKSKEDKLDDEFKREFMVLVNKIKIGSYLSKNIKKTYITNIENKEVEFSYSTIIDIILYDEKYYEFINAKSKYMNLTKPEFVYLLNEFILNKRIFLAFELNNQQITFYKSLMQLYDTYSINQYLKSDFKYSEQVSVNPEYEKIILEKVPKNISLLEKTIYIYLSLFDTLKYDVELDDDTIIKRHKDLTRIKEINTKNNRVFSYEFSCILAKIFEKLGIKFEYNDKYIIAKINKYIVKYKAINATFNMSCISKAELLKGITIFNDNKNTKNEFTKLINSIYHYLFQEKINIDILTMPFNKLITYYRLNTSKISIPFEKKCEIFEKLISNVALEETSMGYIYELKTLIFNSSELDSNISFATISEQDGNKENPVVIITINYININLYNSNKYIYYNPPKKLETYNLNELRMNFFKGRFKYIKNSKDNIIGLEKSSTC